MDKQDSNKLRGRSAIEAVHAGVIGEDEVRLDARISELYGVESDEAAEIHTNYHIDKIIALLAKRAGKNGMKRQTLVERAENLDVSGTARQVAKGKLTEAAAVDTLFRNLSTIESGGKVDDRFSMYG